MHSLTSLSSEALDPQSKLHSLPSCACEDQAAARRAAVPPALRPLAVRACGLMRATGFCRS